MRLRLCGILIVAVSLGLCAPPANAATAKKPKLSIAAASVTEGNAGTSSITFAIKLSKKSRKSVSADYATADGSATAPSDYASSRGTVTVKRKKTRAEITIAVAGDTAVESNETFLVVLSNPKRAKLAAPTAQGTIVNDDSAPPNTDPPPGTDPPPTGADIQLAGLRVRPATVRGGSPVDEQLTVTNAGPEGADGVAIAVTLPAGSVLNTTWSSPSCSAGGPGANCLIGSLASGASQTVVVAAHVPPTNTTQNLSIQAVAAASSPSDPTSGNASFVDSFAIGPGNGTLATSSVSMPRDGMTERKQEVAAGDVLADAYRETYGTDFGFAAGTNIRNGITCNVSTAVASCPNTGGPPFAITRGAVLGTLPFANRIDTLSISGTELWAMLEHSVSSYPAASGAFLHVSGLCFTWDESEPALARVLSVVRQNANGTCSATLIPADTTQYTLAFNSFSVAGGDGFPNFSSRATHRGYDADVFTEWAITHSPLNPAMSRNNRVP